MIEQFYVATELDYLGRNFCRDREFLGHNRAGHDREEAMCARQVRPGAHDRP